MTLEPRIPAWENGTLVARDKLEVHQLGLRHPAVSVFIIAEGKLLMQRRALSKYHTPGLWTNTCCTHPQWDEDPADCAIRRLDDELGIRDVTPDFRKTVEYRADVGGGLTEHEVVDIFVCETARDLAMRLNPDEVHEVRWMTLAELRADIADHPAHYTPWLRIYLDQHLDGLFGDAI